MGKFYGKVGYVVTEETAPGVWQEQITERTYYGDEQQNSRRLSSMDSTNDDFNVSNKISIVADPYAYQNFHAMRYVEFMGALWKISHVDVQRPRLILALGGLYNGKQA